jgi:hypothetical protein
MRKSNISVPIGLPYFGVLNEDHARMMTTAAPIIKKIGAYENLP